jgi:hypothetical protein
VRFADGGRAQIAIAAALTLALAALASIVYTKLSLPVGFLTFLGFLSLPPKAPERRRLVQLLLAVAAVASTAGFARFIVLEAAPGMIQGGRNRTEQHAVSRLREIMVAEDALRKTAVVDPDGDRVGSAALLSELTGAAGVRGADRLARPILSPRHYRTLDETPIGPAALIAGYYFIVCLPTPAGGWTARPGEAVDEERAERRFLAYAWPAATGGPTAAFFIDEHETILTSENLEAGAPRFAGQFFPPRCDSALTEPGAWSAWRGKKPREELPGDRGR